MSCSCLSIHEFILDASLALGMCRLCAHTGQTKCKLHARMSQMWLPSVHKSSMKIIIALIRDVTIKITLGLYINH